MLSQFIIGSMEQSVKSLHDELGQTWLAGTQVMLERPSQLEHGDYSTNIAMQLAKVLRKPPVQIAELIKARLQQDGCIEGFVQRIEVVPPGFINLFINWEKWARTTFNLPDANKGKAVIEHTSINPNKSAHIGHLRNSCIGDCLVRLLQRVGYQVEVHNYIDDLGNQLADTVVGMLHTDLQREHVRFGDFCWDVYAGINKEYEVNPKLIEQRTQVLHALEEGNTNLSWIGMLVAEKIVREHVEEMKQFGIDYDLLVWESSIVKEGFWSAAFNLLKQTPLFYKETEGKLAGCWVLRQLSSNEAEDLEAEHRTDKVLVRSNGILTYTAKDIAYHLWKFGLFEKDFMYKHISEGLWSTHHDGTEKPFGKADLVINVIDHRQQYPQAMVKQALEVLGYEKQAEKLHHVSYGVVSLSPRTAVELGIDTSEGKASYAMSGRQGIGIKISHLLDLMEKVIADKRSDHSGLSSRSIASAAIRYYLLRFNLQTEVIFDLQQATEITGNTGVYLLYAYARAVTLLNKADKELQIIPAVPEQFSQLEDPEYALIRHITAWEDTLITASQELTPNLICSYAYDLAALFNHFYAACPILKADEESKRFRVWLTSKFKDVLGDVLQVLGLPAPERM